MVVSLSLASNSHSCIYAVTKALGGSLIWGGIPWQLGSVTLDEAVELVFKAFSGNLFFVPFYLLLHT